MNLVSWDLLQPRRRRGLELKPPQTLASWWGALGSVSSRARTRGADSCSGNPVAGLAFSEENLVSAMPNAGF